jgi:hypothetical protein
VGTQKYAQNNERLSKPTDMTIHWKALEHFLMVPFDFQFKNWGGEVHFWIFFLHKTSGLKELGLKVSSSMSQISLVNIMYGYYQGLLSDGRGRPVPTGRGRTLYEH